jgi:C-terminal processing protease CtpA/Prc
MLKIEEEMQLFFLKEKDKKEKQVINKNVEDKLELIKIGAPSDDIKKNENNINNTNTNIKIPFAFIAAVSSGSPAEEAGLLPNDGIINFDNKIFYGSFGNPLQKVAEIVKDRINANIYLEVLRIIKDNEGFDKIQYEKINLIPHAWSGQGVLG